MKIEYSVYIVEDANGIIQYDVADEGCDTISISMPKCYFEDEAWALESWCKSNDLKYTEIKKELNYKEIKKNDKDTRR